KICLPLAWPHQLPFTGAPTIASTRFGTGPRADSSITPFDRTQRRSAAMFIPVILIALDLRVLDQLGEVRIVRAVAAIELLGRREAHRDALLGERCPRAFLGEHLAEGGEVPGDDVRRHAGRPPCREPRGVVEVLEALL